MTDLLPMAATVALIACCLWASVRSVRASASCDWMQKVTDDE